MLILSSLRMPLLSTSRPALREIGALLALILLPGLASGPASAVEVSETLEEAREALRMGEYEEASELFGEILEEDDLPLESRAQALLGEGLCQFERGRFDACLEFLKKHEELEKSAALRTLAGKCHLRRGRLKEALGEFDAAIALERMHVPAVYLRGETLRRMGRLEDARKTFDSSLDLYREASFEDVEALGAEGLVYWGLALVGLNRVKEAHELMFDQASEMDAKHPLLLLEWGRLMASKYNFPDSRSFYQEAIEQNPSFADARVALADNYLDDFQVGTQRYDLATKHIEAALEVHPEHAGALANRGLVWYYDGDYDRAVESLNRSLARNPSDLRVLGLLAACLHLKGDAKGVEAVEKRALAVNPRGAEFFHTIAVCIEKKFQYPLVVKFCDRALELDPDYWPVYTTLGINCLRTGEEARGRRFLQKSWDSDRYNVYVYNTREFLGHLDENFRAHRTEAVEYFLPRDDMEILRPYLQPLVEEALTTLSKRYGVEAFRPLRIESFAQHKWFSARTVGLEGFAASGACFGRLVTLTSPRALPQNWGAVAWHELAHVFTLEKTGYRIPRWLTEGISVYEEGLDRPQWSRTFRREVADAWASGQILGIGEFDFGFTRPKFPGQILLSYYQGCLVVEYIVERWGFDRILAILDGYGQAKRSEEIFREVLEIDLDQFDRDFDQYVAKWVKEGGYVPRPAASVIPALELGVEASDDDPDKLLELAWAYVANGNTVDGQLTISRAREKAPEAPDLPALLGFIHLQDKKPEAAAKALELALERGTRFRYRAHAYLGDIRAREGDVEKAIEHYEAAREVSPEAGAAYPLGGRNIYYKLHDLYQKQEKEELALEQMARAAALSPEDGECRLRLVKQALVKKDAPTAARYLDELMYINPFDMQLHRWRSHVAEELEEHEVVIREVKILLQDPRTSELKSRLMLARAHHGLGQREEALRELGAVLNLDPEHEEALELRQEIRQAGG